MESLDRELSVWVRTLEGIFPHSVLLVSHTDTHTNPRMSLPGVYRG